MLTLEQERSVYISKSVSRLLLPIPPTLLFLPLSSYLFRWRRIADPAEPSMLSSATQSLLWAQKQNFWHLISAALALLMRLFDKCETLSKPVFPSNQLAS